MRINTKKEAPHIREPAPTIKPEVQLYFGFHSLCNCNDSQKTLKKNKNHTKIFLNALLEFTKFFEGKNSHTLDIKGTTSPKDYKKLDGEGIKGYLYKFKLDGATSVLVNEQPQPESNKLFIDIGKVGDFH